MNALSQFQRELISELQRALTKPRPALGRETTDYLRGETGNPEPHLRFDVENITLWISPDRATISGQTRQGKKIDRRFEIDDYATPDLMIRSIVLQALHYLDGGNTDVDLR